MSSTPELAIQVAVSNIKEHGLIIFAGAGVSVDHPARVPGWFALNGMIVDALKLRVTKYLGKDPIWLDQVIQGLISRRDSQSFPPEYQAQIIEEQCGESYFRAFSAVDVAQRNNAHAAIAQIARAGYVRAVITTNFDRLIERALEAENIPYQSFFDLEGFQRLQKIIQSGSGLHGIPIIKIHGSVESTPSIVDTLQQRLLGRGETLTNILFEWLGRHEILYLGFSAADLNHDPEYLGLRESATRSPGALYVLYPGSIVEPGAKALWSAYGDKGHVFEATLNETFSKILNGLGLEIPKEPPTVDTDPKGTVFNRIKYWAKELDPYEAINILSALLDAGGEENAAWKILHRAWESRPSKDTRGKHYAKYQYNYARHCIQSGEMQYEETPQNFKRSEKAVPQSRAGLALWGLYRAKPDLFSSLLVETKSRALHAKNARLEGDLMIVYAQAAVIYRIAHGFNEIVDQANFQRKRGDLPRALKLWSAAARLAAQSEDPSQTFSLFDHCEYWVNYLGDDTLSAELYLAQGVACLTTRSETSVLSNLNNAIPILRDYQRWPLLIEGLLAGIRVYTTMGLQNELNALVEEASQRIAKGYEIYYPHLGIAVAEYHLSVKQPDRAKRELIKARPYAVESQNTWALKTIDNYLLQVEGK